MLDLNGGHTVNFITNGDLNLTDPIYQTGTVNKSGTGTLIVSVNNNSNTDPYFSLFLNAGILRANANNALGDSTATGAITFGGGTLQYNVASPTDWSPRIKNSTAPISVDTNGNSITWAGTIDSSNTMGLTKSGSGALILSGTNAYSGGTTVSAGTLRLGNALALGSTSAGLTVSGGARPARL